MSKPLQSLIAFCGFVVVAIVCLNMLGNTLARYSTPAKPAHKPTPTMPASITLNLGGSAWICNLNGSSYNCVIRVTRWQNR
jgi:hypothetical protein